MLEPAVRPDGTLEGCRVVPDVSVIIPAYNAMPYVTKTLETVLGQSLGQDKMELVAVDNGSTDGTLTEFERFAEMWSGMRVIHLDENSGGPAHPRNVGLEHAQGRYVFFLDSDDYLGTEALERMVAVADEQETDVVLGRMVGVGGRRGPRSMFTHNQPRTDVFESKAYWTLNPMKLFRRELVEQLGLRFVHELSPAEDQPFVALAYLNASAISIISDYDCVYWTKRSDGSNLSGAASLESQLRIHSVMLPLIIENTEPGPQRDHLLQRHFEMGLFSAVRFLSCEVDPGLRDRAYKQIREWVDELYSQSLGMRMSVFKRVLYGLVQAGRIEEIAEVWEFHREDAPRHLVVEGDHAYDPYPFFRDSDVGLPDWCYDDTSRLRVDRYLSSLSWEDRALRIAGAACIERVETPAAEASIFLRERGSGIEHDVPLAVPASDPDELDPSGEGFVTLLDPCVAADGHTLANGLWDVFVQVRCDGIELERRLGGVRAPEIDATPRTRIVTSDDGRSTVTTTYFTANHSNLTLEVGEAKHALRLDVGSTRWDPDHTAALEMDATVAAAGLPSDSIAVRLTDRVGQQYDIPAHLSETDGVTRASARLSPRQAAAGRGLPDGDWEMHWALLASGIERKEPLPRDERPPTVRWWRGLRPMHAQFPKGSGSVLVLRIVPVHLVRALQRRLGMRS